MGYGGTGYASIGYGGSGLGYRGIGSVGLGMGGGYSPDPGAGTATQMAFGTIAGAPASGADPRHARRMTHCVLSVGTLSLLTLVYIWWSLPR
jgi:hypothetical protein